VINFIFGFIVGAFVILAFWGKWMEKHGLKPGGDD
jgi:hypothetical protein